MRGLRMQGVGAAAVGNEDPQVGWGDHESKQGSIQLEEVGALEAVNPETGQ